jgi:asparagine synthase (glutamine-hydrolysing)
LLNWTSKSEDLWGGSERTLSGRQIDDVLQWSLPTLLRYEDRNSMGYGVESRLPFMDYRLLELAVALPARLKIRNGYGKWVLRKMTAGVVPDIVRLNRKKRGFDVTQAWVREGIGAHLRRTIGDNRSAVSDHLQRGIDLNRMLSDEALSNDSNLLDEALMLAWLTKPVRRPVQARAMAEVA